VKTEQKAWMEVINWLMRWAEETKEEIKEKINFYSKDYSGKVLERLIQKDYEVYINRYDERWEKMKKEIIDDLMQKQGDDNEPDGSFPYWIDEDGLHYKGGKK